MCDECVAEVPNGLACKSSCEERVIRINRALDLNQQVVTTSNSQIRSHALMTLVMGLLFTGFGIWSHATDAGFLDWFFGLTGIVLLAYGFSRLRARPYPQAETK